MIFIDILKLVVYIIKNEFNEIKIEILILIKAIIYIYINASF